MTSVTRSALRNLLQLLRPRWPRGVGALLCIGVVSLTTAVYAWLAGPVMGTLFQASSKAPTPDAGLAVPEALSGDVLEAAYALAAAVVVTSAARGLASFGSAILLARLQQDVVRDLRLRVYEHLLQVTPTALIAHGKGELGSRVAGDVQQVESLINIAVAPLVRNLVTAFTLAVLLFQFDPTLAALALIGIPAVAAVVARATRRSRTAWRQVHDERSRVASSVTEVAGMIALVRAYQAEDLAAEAFARQADRAHDRVMRARKVYAVMTPVVGVLGALAVAVTLLVATGRLQDGTLSAETYVSFFAALFFLYRPVQGLGSTVAYATSGLAALDRVGELLALERDAEEPEDAVDVPHMRHTLEARNVHFAYGDRQVLHDVDLSIHRGESIALVGPNGGGKTTLLLMLLGILRPTRGEVMIDGEDIARATRASTRRQFAWVPQEPLLFADTVLQNIALGDPDPDPVRVRRAARAAGAHEFVESLADGYETVLAEGGADLSGGQRQRLCIARALYRDSPILVLDEPTAALDGNAERELARTIEALLGERTVILVSHRESTVRRADRVVVVEGGEIVEDGAPDALWNRQGAFRALFSVNSLTV